MALILGVKIGDVVDIAEHWVAVLSIDGRSTATLIGNKGRKIAVNADEMTEVAPDVWVGLGLELTMSKLRLVVDAPRHFPITRRHD